MTEQGVPSTSEPLVESQERDWSASAAVTLVAAMLVGTLAAGAAQVAVEDRLSTSAGVAVDGLLLISVYLVVLGLAWVLSPAKSGSAQERLQLRRPGMSLGTLLVTALGIGIAGRLVTLVWASLLQAFDVRLPGDELDPTVMFGEGAAAIFFALLVTVVVAPVVEEVVFRGAVLGAVRGRWGARAGILVSAAAFAAIHYYLFAIPPIFVLALLLGRAFVRSDSLWLPIAGHAAFNGIGLALLYVLKGAGLA